MPSCLPILQHLIIIEINMPSVDLDGIIDVLRTMHSSLQSLHLIGPRFRNYFGVSEPHQTEAIPLVALPYLQELSLGNLGVLDVFALLDILECVFVSFAGDKTNFHAEKFYLSHRPNQRKVNSRECARRRNNSKFPAIITTSVHTPAYRHKLPDFVRVFIFYSTTAMGTDNGFRSSPFARTSSVVKRALALRSRAFNMVASPASENSKS